jgi:light-regulated signal transduction histidine kinase (bacteriophytochrome)
VCVLNIHPMSDLSDRRREASSVTTLTGCKMKRSNRPREETRDEIRKEIQHSEIQDSCADLERRLRQRTAQLEAANHEMEVFTYAISHDLRAPLRHINGFSRLLLEDFHSSLPGDAQRHVQRIADATRRMGMLVDDLLNLARVSRSDLTLQRTGLKSLVEGVIVSLQPEFADRLVDWKVSELPFVECDPALLTQVFRNLIANALKFTRPRSHAVIEIGARQKNDTHIIYVRDNGVGFNMKYAGKLFGVFQRLHRPEEFEGTGIELAIVQRIIQKHGGRIWAEAELDLGATFYFTLGVIEKTELTTTEMTRTQLITTEPITTERSELKAEAVAAGDKS